MRQRYTQASLARSRQPPPHSRGDAGISPRLSQDSVFHVSALNSDPSDLDVLIKLEISNAFNALCRQLTLDVLGGKASCDYACGLKEGDSFETVCEELRNMFEYF